MSLAAVLSILVRLARTAVTPGPRRPKHHYPHEAEALRAAVEASRVRTRCLVRARL
jgi:hypothetical protein